MMRIRDSVARDFSALMDRSFEDRLIDLLLEHCPGTADIASSDLRDTVRRQIGGAGSHGLRSEADVAIYVLCSGLLGEDFDSRFPAACEMLNSPCFKPEEKAAWLSNWTEELFRTLEKKD